MEFFNDIGGDPLKPSLFELIAQEQLRDLLQPALKYVLAVSLVSSSIHSSIPMPPGVRATISALFDSYRKPSRRVLRNDHALRGTVLSSEIQ